MYAALNPVRCATSSAVSQRSSGTVDGASMGWVSLSRRSASIRASSRRSSGIASRGISVRRCAVSATMCASVGTACILGALYPRPDSRRRPAGALRLLDCDLATIHQSGLDLVHDLLRTVHILGNDTTGTSPVLAVQDP